MRRAAVLWIVFLVIYLFFAAPLSSSEIIAGVPSAAVITAFALLYRRAEERRMDLRTPPWSRVIVRVLTSIPVDVVRVGAALARSLRHPRQHHIGVVSDQPFRYGTETAADATRRAIVVLGTSLAPNGYVLTMPEGGEAIVLHRLVPTPPQTDTMWPV